MKGFEQRTTGITSKSIEKRFGSLEPWKMVSEYIWNGLDADATKVEVILNTSDLGGVESVEIHDNGEGIDFRNLESNFDNFDDSSKNRISQKGSQGRGRYAFHKYATKAAWFTRNKGKNALIEIQSDDLTRYKFSILEQSEQKNRIKEYGKGTSVFLTEIPKSSAEKIPEVKSLINDLSKEFGWKLIVSKNVIISVNGENIVPPEHHLHEHNLELGGIDCHVAAIRWEQKPTSEKSYNYFLNAGEDQVYRTLTGFNYKNEFYLSAYISSGWFDSFKIAHEKNSDLFIDESKSTSSGEFKKLEKLLRELSTSIYRSFLVERAEALVERFEAKGYFPQYPNESADDRDFRLLHVKNVVKSICVADPSTFNNLKPKQIKIIIALLDKLTVSNENDSLFEVIQGILELDKEQLEEFAAQIKISKLDHVIATIGLLQRRDSVVQKMKCLFREHAHEVLETPDLQGIIEANTWLFGPLYETVGAEEDDFTKLARELWKSDKGITSLNSIDEQDLIDGATITGAKGQVDLFLARKMVTIDHSTQRKIYKCTIIEIKRPSIGLNKKHFDQVERYAEVLHNHPGFNDENMIFDVILVGTKISRDDYRISKALRDNAKNGQGLVSGSEDRIKVYVKTWATIFNDFDLTYSSLLEQLKINRKALETESKISLVNDLQIS